ncbi:MAG: CBS domain-containing protein, partial [Verrucomicrobiales bacterium]
RAGAVIVVEASGALAGIFTQGDFARAFQSGKPDIGSQAVRDFMTKNPISVHESKLVGEVLRILEESRIDDLVVVNDARIPLGMIDTQDLTRLQIV